MGRTRLSGKIPLMSLNVVMRAGEGIDQEKLNGRKPKRPWFVRVGPFGGMMPWSVAGWLWFACILAGTLGFAFYGDKLTSAGDVAHGQVAFAAAGTVLIVGLVVALSKSTKP